MRSCQLSVFSFQLQISGTGNWKLISQLPTGHWQRATDLTTGNWQLATQNW